MTPERWREVDLVLQEALGRGEPDRSAYLAQIATRDPALCLEVEGLLAEHRLTQSRTMPSQIAGADHPPGTSSGVVTGDSIGAYTIVARLGAGGMGEVFRARDPKLGRDVAIKILPRVFSLDPERLARFEREARILASQNHPHIGAIYGLENTGGTLALVLELIEGDTLAERIADGPLAVEDAVPLATQIAEALEAAHDRGIVHRDLKPANIKVTPDSSVKVLDFGLAKAAAGSEASPDLARSPTITALAGTHEGTLLGTAAYMSPEQARGKSVDRRTDMWAFGCVLYEMLSGRPAFGGATLADTLSAIISREPDWTALPAGTPRDVQRLLKRCLEKNPSRRLRDAADVRMALEDVLNEPATMAETTAVARPSHGRVALIVALVAMLAAAAAWTLKPSAPPLSSPVTRLSVTLPPGDTLGLTWPAIALSGDGRLLAYTAGRALLPAQLFVRAIDSLDGVLVPGSEGAKSPFFSPDGRWIGFFAQGKLKKVLASGGGLETLCDAASAFGGSWGRDGWIYFAPFNTSGIWKVPASGGRPAEVTKLNRTLGEASHRWPQITPDGKALLFTVWTGPGWDEKHLVAQLTDGGERRLLVSGASTGRYLSTGQLLYARNDEMFVVPFDLKQVKVTGPPVTLVDRASEQANAGEGAQVAVADSGTLAYVRSASHGTDRRMVWVGPGGTVEPLNSPPGAYVDPSISPDGGSVAVSMQGPRQAIWIYDLARSTLTTLPSPGSSQAPTWTRDGRRLAYRGTQAGYRNIFWRAADGSDSEERLTTDEALQTPASVAPHDAMLLFDRVSPATGRDIWMLRLDGSRRAQPVLNTQFNEWAGRLSPDGRWMAYASDESGRREIYLRRYPEPGGRLPISTSGGDEPVWSRDGAELFYRNGDQMMAVTIGGGSAPAVGTARLQFEGHYQVSDAGIAGYDVSPDRRFLMIASSAAEQPVNQITVVLNWSEELKRTLAAGAR